MAEFCPGPKLCTDSEPGKVIAYCGIGERSTLTWSVLKHLLGYPDVRSYDGS